ncbi:MAG: ATP-binding protein [Caldilineaceae bacterium]
MRLPISSAWHEANQQYLMAALAAVRQALVEHAAKHEAPAITVADEVGATQSLAALAATMPHPPALETLCTVFKLSVFERALLLLCAGVELAADFAPLCAAAQGDAQRHYPTFSVALAALPDAHWSALTPNAPLRRWHLLQIEPGRTLVHSPLRIDERILHYLVGINQLDERLAGLLHLLPPPDTLVDSQQRVADAIAATWTQAGLTTLPVIQLCGPELDDKQAIAAAACTQLGLDLYRLPQGALPTNPSEVEPLVRLWEREAALSNCALLLDADGQVAGAAELANSVTQFLAAGVGPFLLSSRERQLSGQQPLVVFDVAKPAQEEQKRVWENALGATAVHLNGQLDAIVAQFNLSRPAILSACLEAQALGRVVDAEAPVAQPLDEMVWELCRRQARPRLDDLAQRIEPAATWDELVLPAMQRELLHELAVHVRQRRQIYEQWGFAAKSKRGLGISALFAGASGTGKTMAAEVLAATLRLDLYRIDLSTVVSKYIGETEKNLRRIFDAAETSGVILLFDEADALFGKRSQVKDSHDRYANIEVSYLLQRMEAYRGLAILTTNMKDALDSAFLRRLQFVVHFPLPDAAQRAEIWQRVFPPQTPTAGLDVTKLARLNIAGGNIRNIAVNAAFLAADAGEKVNMRHLLRATQREYAKLERTLTDAEIQGWAEPRPA